MTCLVLLRSISSWRDASTSLGYGPHENLVSTRMALDNPLHNQKGDALEILI